MVCNRTADIRGLKPKLRSSAHRDGSALVSFSQLWAMHVVHPPTDSQTNTHDRILYYSRVDYPTHGESVCVGISAHHYRRRRNPFFFFFPQQDSVPAVAFFSWALSLRCFSFHSSRDVFRLTPRFHVISAALHAERHQHASLDHFGEAEIPVKKKKRKRKKEKKKKMNEQTFILSHTSSRKWATLAFIFRRVTSH